VISHRRFLCSDDNDSCIMRATPGPMLKTAVYPFESETCRINLIDVHQSKQVQ
jgi:hypothetical protein